MATQYSEEFKKDAVKYWEEHKDLGINACAKNLGISKNLPGVNFMKVMRVIYQPEEEAITKVMLQKKMLDLRKN